MAKHRRKAEAKLNRRIKGCMEARDHQKRVNRNPKITANVEKAFKLPGSMKR